MDEQMEEVCEKVCVFEETLDIDFDYEFDVAKFFDFTRPETAEEVIDSESWFHLAQGYPPSPLLVKLGSVTDELGGSATSSPKCGQHYAYSTSNDGGISELSGPEILKSKLKPATRSCLSKSSRLLQPTASQLAKQNQQKGTRGAKVPARMQKLGSPLNPAGDNAATKRQKLDIGYLRKVAQLKHQTSFSHKLPKKVASSTVNSPARPKVTNLKEPRLETANRAQRLRSKTSAELSRDSSFKAQSLNRKILDPKTKSTKPFAPVFQRSSVRGAKTATQNVTHDLKRTNSIKASKIETSDQMYKFQARPLNKKEPLLSNTKKLLQNPPIEMFGKLSLNSENRSRSLLEGGHCLETKVAKKNAVPCSMKGNKNANTITGKPTRCCLKQSQMTGGRMATVI